MNNHNSNKKIIYALPLSLLIMTTFTNKAYADQTQGNSSYLALGDIANWFMWLMYIVSSAIGMMLVYFVVEYLTSIDDDKSDFINKIFNALKGFVISLIASGFVTYIKVKAYGG